MRSDQTWPALDERSHERVLMYTGATGISDVAVVQRLWSGYGSLLRIALSGCARSSVILKQVVPPRMVEHPRGWQGATADARKRRSYLVEETWYKEFAARSSSDCRMPDALAIERHGVQSFLLLEDLAPDYPCRPTALDESSVLPCLTWLAALHAANLDDPAHGLWDQGCYWHLSTRHEEFSALPDGPLKRAAAELDRALRSTTHSTLVHGDAKLANFLFSQNGELCAAVDFQYVGRGCGIRDVAYLLGSCLDADQLERHSATLLTYYGKQLASRLAIHRPNVDAGVLTAAWLDLYPVACADFHRFLLGWAPAHRKIDRHMHRCTNQALALLS